jgi:CheY-like chemotaxis protein
MLKHVFEPFSQADSSLERSRGGLGLGLALVKGLVELHGGEVAAASAGEGRGAEFTIRLPLADASRESTPTASPDSPPTPPLRILIIDDQRDASLPMRTLLELDGHEVEVATTGPQGIDTAQRWRPDVILCDIGLPGGMNGYAVAQMLRQDALLRSVLLVAVTGYGQEEDRRHALDAGFDRHLTKPVGISELRVLLTDVESARQTRGDAAGRSHGS